MHGVSLFEDLEGVSFQHIMTLIGSEFMQKAVFIELVQVCGHASVHALCVCWSDHIICTCIPYRYSNTVI